MCVEWDERKNIHKMMQLLFMNSIKLLVFSFLSLSSFMFISVHSKESITKANNSDGYYNNQQKKKRIKKSLKDEINYHF